MSPLHHSCRGSIPFAAAGIALLAMGQAQAGKTGYWIKPYGGNWTDPANWEGGVIPNGPGDAAVFDFDPSTSGVAPLVVDDTVILGSWTIRGRSAHVTGRGKLLLNNIDDPVSIALRAGLIVNIPIELLSPAHLTTPYARVNFTSEVIGAHPITIDGGDVSIYFHPSFTAPILLNRGRLSGFSFGSGGIVVTSATGARLTMGSPQYDLFPSTDVVTLHDAQGDQAIYPLGAIGGLVFEGNATMNRPVDLGPEGSVVGFYSPNTTISARFKAPVSGGSLTVAGGGGTIWPTVYLDAENSYTGTTTVLRGARLSVTGSIRTSSDLAIAGYLVNNASPSPTAPMRMLGGLFDASAVEHGPLILQQGRNIISVPSSGLPTPVTTFASISRERGAIVCFNTGFPRPNLGKCRFTVPANLDDGILGGWAIACPDILSPRMTTFAAFSPEDGTPIPVTVVPLDQAGEHDNAQAAGTLAGDKTVNSLQFKYIGLDLGGHKLTVDTGGVLLESSPGVSNGILLPGESSGGELFVYSITGTSNVGAHVADTPFGKTSLTLVGPVRLSVPNAHTGGTFVNAGIDLRTTTTVIGHPGALPAGTDLTINDTQTSLGWSDGTIMHLNAVTLRGGALSGTRRINAQSWLVEDGTIEAVLAGSGPMRKVGLGKAIFKGDNSLYTGTVEIEGGLVDASGPALGKGLVRVHSDAVLTGAGPLNGTVELCGGSLAIPHQPAIVTADSRLVSPTGVAPSAGSLVIRSGAALQCGASFLFGGDLHVDGSLLDPGPVRLLTGRILSGTGLINDQIIMAAGAILSPGNSAGRLSVDSAIWRNGGIYRWEIADASGLPGEGWDLLDIDRYLWTDLAASDTFTLQLIGSGADGGIDRFRPSRDYEWLIARTPLLRSFDASRFTVDTTELADEPPGGTIELVAVPDGLALRYAAVPEPGAASSLLLALGLLRPARRPRGP